MGASSRGDGLSTTAFPTNSGGGSIEALEASAPLLIMRKEFRPDSGGAGRWRGGLGQDIEVTNASPTPVRLTLLGDRERHPPLGIMGGRAGDCAAAQLDTGVVPSLKSVTSVPPGGTLRLAFAGGGGYGHPDERDRARVARDLADGLITAEAVRDYGVDPAAGP
jgi:N-methylhydantoinase B